MAEEEVAGDGQDPVVALSRELDKGNAGLALAHEKHEAVRKKLGDRAPPPSELPRMVPKPAIGTGAYRGNDGVIALQRAVDEAKSAASKLRAENSDLESQCAMEFPSTPFG